MESKCLPPPHSLGLRHLLFALASWGSAAASANEVYVAEYFDDGETLHLIQGWEDPFAQLDPDTNFQTNVSMPLSTGSGGGFGWGSTNGMNPISGNSEVDAPDLTPSKPASTASLNSSSQPCPRRRCPPQVVTGRRINASGTIRVVFQQDNGDGFSMFARRAREEPPENFLELEGMNCTTDSEITKPALAALAHPLDLRLGTEVTGTFPGGGSETWTVECRVGRPPIVNQYCTPSLLLGGGNQPTRRDCPPRQ